MQVTVAPIPIPFLERVRSEGIDDLGQPVKRLEAKGGEPCRDLLRRARAGEALILASFTPFTKAGPYREYGPIFVTARESGEVVHHDRLPAAGSSGDYLREQVVIRAYSAGEEIIDAELIRAPEIEATIARFFDSPATAFLHIRFPAYGCFACRVDRG
jgi:hypothetical protein